mmetsp:Transcript_24567/g.60723  ORF Transcript_24567/g.60723 Transcript_24567/m.60723 type:complete len:134 (-) Transcript_24567:79-480(-)
MLIVKAISKAADLKGDSSSKGKYRRGRAEVRRVHPKITATPLRREYAFASSSATLSACNIFSSSVFIVPALFGHVAFFCLLLAVPFNARLRSNIQHDGRFLFGFLFPFLLFFLCFEAVLFSLILQSGFTCLSS